MNAPVRRVAVACSLMLMSLLLAANWVQAVKADELRTKPGNARVIIQEYERQRGPIVVDGRAIAASVATNDKLKYLRRYAPGEIYAPVTGFYSFVYGASGIEQADNGVLSGTDSRLFVNRVTNLLTGEGTSGGSVTLTINPAAQKAAYDALRKAGNGAVVALNPSTGAILAMVTNPSYDPNLLASHDATRNKAAWNALNASPGKPLLNRSISQTYPPGSTFKIVTLAAALESGKYTPTTPVPGPAKLDVPQTSADIRNSSRDQCSPGSDTTTLVQALKKSCNTTFAAVGLALGDAALREQAEKFGFNRDDIDVPMRAARSVFPGDIDKPQTAQSAIGQFDVRATALQMAMVSAAIANRGTVMKPYLVADLRAPDLSVLERTQPQDLGAAVSPQTAATITQMMTEVVNGDGGTGRNARIEGITVAGKTGTAQVGQGRSPHAWFTSFAPAGNPQIAVAVVVENGGGATEVSGGRIAAPIAKAVMEAVLKP